MTPACLVCERPTDGYACTHCGITQPGRWLDEITDLVPVARDIALGLARLGSGGGSSSEGRIPLNLSAGARLDAVQNALTTIARHIAETRGVSIP